ncbi:MAG: hypothetical protein ACXV4B_04940 [Halobacteriota archaeon]
MNEFDRYERKLNETLCKASAQEKGLLVANARAHCNVYRTELLTRNEVLSIRDSVDASDARQYNNALRSEEAVFDYLLGIQLRYLALRERLASVAELFSVCAQTVHFGDLLNDISWGKNKSQHKLRKDITSHTVWFGELSLNEEDGYESIDISPSGPIREATLARVSAARALAIELKTRVAVAREFMAAKDVHLKAYEEYLTGIEGELSGLIHSVKGRLYCLDGEGGEQLRDFLATTDNELYALMEALPDYEALTIDEALYTKERTDLVRS